MKSEPVISAEVHARIASEEALSLELGCGARKRHPEALGVDLIAYPGVDIVGGIEEVLERLPAGRISAVYTYHCFEHLDNLPRLVTALARVMRKGASLVVVVPHFSNPYFYSDATHRQAFGLYTFSYLARERLFARRCPTYERRFDFDLNRVQLVFKSPPPFYARYGFKKIVQTLVNLNRYTLEFYEENFSWIIPCYEIRYDLQRR